MWIIWFFLKQQNPRSQTSISCPIKGIITFFFYFFFTWKLPGCSKECLATLWFSDFSCFCNGRNGTSNVTIAKTGWRAPYTWYFADIIRRSNTKRCFEKDLASNKWLCSQFTISKSRWTTCLHFHIYVERKCRCKDCFFNFQEQWRGNLSNDNWERWLWSGTSV